MKPTVADECDESLVSPSSDLAVFDPTDMVFVVVQMAEGPVSAPTDPRIVPVGELNGRDVERLTKLRKRSIVRGPLLPLEISDCFSRDAACLG
jgi:hypothetical protein